MGTRYLFELSGELDGMPLDEAATVARIESGGDCRLFSAGPGYAVIDIPDSALNPISKRLALTRFAGRHLGSYELREIARVSEIELPEGTFAIRSKRFEGMMREVNSQDLIRKIGATLSRDRRVDLERPDTVVRMLISDRIHLFIQEVKFDAGLIHKRKVSERPFFSPISLHPKYARALINLTGVKRGDTVLDPFCGTGGIAIEAAEMGMRALVSDFDPEMVAGTRENMEFYGLELEDYDAIDISYVPDRFPGVDAIVCDPPYGRSAKTGGEPVDGIYGRALEAFPKALVPGGKAGVVLPHVYDPGTMKLDRLYEQFVHGSLSRFYHLYSRA